MLKATCRCENVVELDLPSVINLDDDPEILKELVEGTAYSTKCPRCGTTIHAELPLTVKTFDTQFVVVPEIDRIAVYMDKSDIPGNSEILVGYQELYERARILNAKCNPMAIEVIKYYLQAKAEEANSDAEITILFNGKVEDYLEFHVIGLEKDKTGVLKVPFATYEKANKDLKKTIKEDPFKMVFNGRYKSYKKLNFISE